MNKVLILVLFFLFSVNILLAQNGTSFMYSNFGLGSLEGEILPQYNALGGGITAFSDFNSINPYNPATYISYNTNSFLFSTGGVHEITNEHNNFANQVTNNTMFSHLIMAFPINRNFGASIGILPFSNVGYEFNFRDDIDSLQRINSGEGGISEIYFGGAYKLTDEFSFGVNASYLFGGINKTTKVVYDNITKHNVDSVNNVNLKGYFYEIGLLYKKKLLDNKEISFGFSGNNDTEIRGKKRELVEGIESVTNIDIIKDTTIYGYAKLPQQINVGLSFRDAQKWLFVADYTMQNWGDYKIFGESENLNNSAQISGGIQYTPEYNSVTKYFKRIQYRLGVSYSNTPLQFNNERTLSFGFGIPVKRSKTKYDISCTLGQREGIENNLTKKQFIRIGLNVSYDGLWFVKRKYD